MQCLEAELDLSVQKIDELTDKVNDLESKVQILTHELDHSNKARNDLGQELEAASNKIIEIEEQLYESKSV